MGICDYEVEGIFLIFQIFPNSKFIIYNSPSRVMFSNP
jgi:hypothetical protein